MILQVEDVGEKVEAGARVTYCLTPAGRAEPRLGQLPEPPPSCNINLPSTSFNSSACCDAVADCCGYPTTAIYAVLGFSRCWWKYSVTLTSPREHASDAMDEGVATASRGGPEVTGVGWSLPCSLSSLLAMNCRARAEGLARRLQSRVRIGSNGSSAFEETSLVNPGPEDHYASMEYRHSTQGPEDHYAALEYRHSSFDGTHMDLLEDSKLRPIHVVTSEPTLHLCLPSPPPLGNLPEQDSDVYYDFDLASPDEVLEGEEEDEEEQQQQQQAHQQQQQEVEEHQHNEAGERPESGCVTSVTSPVMFDNERDDEESEEADSATPGELFPPEESLVCSPDADLRAVRQLLSYSSLTDALSSTAEPAANYGACKQADNYGIYEQGDNSGTCEQDTDYSTCAQVDTSNFENVDSSNYEHGDNYGTCEEGGKYGTCEDTCEVVDNYGICEEVDNHDTCEEVDNHDTCEVDNHGTCEVDNHGTCEEVDNYDTCEDTCEVVDNHDTCEEVDNYGTCEDTCEVVDNHDTCEEVDNYGTCEDTCEVDNHDTSEVDNHDTCEVDNYGTCEQVDNYGTCEQVDNYGTCEQVDNYGTCEEVENHDPCEQVNNHGTCEQGDNYDTSEQGGNSNCEQRDKYGTFEQGDNSSCEPGDNKVTSEQSEPCVQSDEHEVAGCERRGCACACCDSEQGAHEGSTQVAGVEPLPVSGTEGAGEAVPGWCPTTGSALVTSPVAKSGPDQCHASRGTAPVGPTLSPDSNPSGSTLTHCASNAYTNSDQEISEACRVEHCVMIDNEGQNKVDEGHEPTQEWEGVDGQRAAGFVASVTVKYSVIETGFTDGDGKPEMAPRWDDETIVKTSPEIEAVPRAISGWTPPVADSHLYTPSEEPRAAMEARDDEADLRVHDEIFSMDLDNEEIETLDEDAEGNEEEVENEEDIEEETILTGKFRNIRGYTERVRRLSEEAEDRPPSVTVISYEEESMSQPEEASQVAEVKDVVEEHVCSVELASQLSNLQVEDVGIQVDAGDTEESSDEAENRSSEETDPERVEDFKMRIKRSSSLKCGKTPPGTPGRKKIVRFADMLGLDLAAVRTFLGGGVPHVPRSAFWDLQVENEAAAASSGYTCQVTEPPIPRRLLTPLFQQPGTQINFLERVRNQRVVVENVEVGDDMSVRGFVRVLNLDFHKSVCVRYTFDHWRNFHEATATYVPGSYDGLTDRFTFLLWGSFLQDNGALAFCVRYQTLGQEFWDNNHGRNYVLQCYMTPNIPGGRVASPRPQNSTSVQQHYSGGGQSSARSDYNCFVGSPTTPSDPWVTTFF